MKKVNKKQAWKKENQGYANYEVLTWVRVVVCGRVLCRYRRFDNYCQ
jgi:hypothetical protein